VTYSGEEIRVDALVERIDTVERDVVKRGLDEVAEVLRKRRGQPLIESTREIVSSAVEL